MSYSDIQPERDIKINMSDMTKSEYDNEEIVEYLEEPIQLIEFQGSKFKLNPEALKIINSIENDVIVVSIVGKARTGKSYLMNLLLDRVGKEQGFQVQSSTNSCTKGIWLWGSPRKSRSGNDAKIIFMDSEGTSSIDAGTRTYDSRIFAMVVLLSSLFIYNSESHIDEHSISELSLAAHISNAISTNSGIDKDSLITQLAPKFIWVLRNFTLEKKHPDTGQEISSKEYMEMCLRNKTSGKNSKDNNLIRQNILKFFPERDCFTLVRPVDSEQELKNLNKIPFDNLKANFKWEYTQLKDKIYRETTPKKFNGKKLNGPTLVHLIVEFVNAINSGVVPNINNSWDSVIEKDIKDYYEKAVCNFKQKTKFLESKLYEQEDLYKHIFEYKLESLMIYNKIYYQSTDVFADPNYNRVFLEVKSKLDREITKIEEKLINNNLDKTNNRCRELIKGEFKEINKKLFNENYTSKLFIEEYTNEFDNALRRYQESEDCKGLKKLNVLAEFLIHNEKNFMENLKKTLNSENEKSHNKLDIKFQQVRIDVEDFEYKNNNQHKTNNSLQETIARLQKEVAREERETLDYRERLENLQKELKIIEQSEKQGINYEYPPKKPIKQMEPYNDQEDRQKTGKKKNECGCKCYIF